MQVNLLPNNSSITNMFEYSMLFSNASTPVSSSGFANSFVLAYSDPRLVRNTISTKTICKSILSISNQLAGTSSANWQLITEYISSHWQATASTHGPGDTTTAWTSLGTISSATFPLTGRIVVKRLA